MDVNETNNQKFHSQPSYYAIIPADVRYCKALIPMARLLYSEITALCNKEGFCWATNSYFAELYEVAPTTISEWVGQLIKHGFIKVEIPDKVHRKIYLTLREKPKQASGKAEAYPSGKAEANITSVINKINKSGVGFEEFWKAYPKKVEKKKAEAKWNRLKKFEQEAILADLPKRKATDQWQRGYVPNPMTYLNGERWNDELPADQKKEQEKEIEREREQARQNRIMEQRAEPNSPGAVKFRELMKNKLKIGRTM